MIRESQKLYQIRTISSSTDIEFENSINKFRVNWHTFCNFCICSISFVLFFAFIHRSPRVVSRKWVKCLINYYLPISVAMKKRTHTYSTHSRSLPTVYLLSIPDTGNLNGAIMRSGRCLQYLVNAKIKHHNRLGYEFELVRVTHVKYITLYCTILCGVHNSRRLIQLS